MWEPVFQWVAVYLLIGLIFGLSLSVHRFVMEHRPKDFDWQKEIDSIQLQALAATASIRVTLLAPNSGIHAKVCILLRMHLLRRICKLCTVGAPGVYLQL
jgi:hypothetical protein